MRNRQTTAESGNRGLGLGITSLILGLISLVPTIFSIYMFVESMALAKTEGLEFEEALGNAFGAFFTTIIFLGALVISAIISTIGLGFGIGSLVKSKNKAPRIVGLTGTIVTGLCLLGTIASFVARVLIK